MKERLKIGDKIIINTPSCSTQPYDIGKLIVGKKATVIWIKNFEEMQGICVLLDEEINLFKGEIISAWSYFLDKEFILCHSDAGCRNMKGGGK